MKLLFATTNAHKAEEVRAILAHTSIELETLDQHPELGEPPETGNTFEHNALQKARYVFERTGLPTIADDSGIEVDALNGRPGVHSKRYSAEATHEANNTKLLGELDNLPSEQRTARFRCVLALITSAGEGTVDGRCEGTIATELSGEGGFGYDPLFLPTEAPGRSMAELSMSEKNAISHRGRAFARLPELLERVQ